MTKKSICRTVEESNGIVASLPDTLIFKALMLKANEEIDPEG